MGKKALCISKDQANEPIEKWVTKLIDRDICETDESVLQIIPYITLIDKLTEEIFSYTRGSGGKENRLHSKISIGIGGHIDIDTSEDLDIISVIAKEAVREIEEEVGCQVSEDYIESMLENGEYVILHVPQSDNQVDRVHIGVAIGVEVNKHECDKLEDGVIMDIEWLSEEELISICKEKQIRLEKWSDILAKSLIEVNAKDNEQSVYVEFTTSNQTFNIVLNVNKESISEQLLRWHQGNSSLFGYDENGYKMILGKDLGPVSICTLR